MSVLHLSVRNTNVQFVALLMFGEKFSRGRKLRKTCFRRDRHFPVPLFLVAVRVCQIDCQLTLIWKHQAEIVPAMTKSYLEAPGAEKKQELIQITHISHIK